MQWEEDEEEDEEEEEEGGETEEDLEGRVMEEGEEEAEEGDAFRGDDDDFFGRGNPILAVSSSSRGVWRLHFVCLCLLFFQILLLLLRLHTKKKFMKNRYGD